MRRFSVSVGRLVVLGALGCSMTVLAGTAQAYVPSPPYLRCFNNSEGDLLVLERSLSPAINAFVQAGTPVTFSGDSSAPVTFAVASSPASLSSPDLAEGLGTLQPGGSTYAFTSSAASATAGVLVYWEASFSNATLNGCEGATPKTYTTQVHTFTVVAPPPSQAEVDAKRQQEEAAAAASKKKQEEAAAVPAAIGGGVSLDGSTIAVQGDGMALVKLNCLGSAGCHGKLALAAKIASKAKGRKQPLYSATIATVGFSIAGDETKTSKVELDAAGRELLSADHGRLNASLTILELAPNPENTQTKTVRLVELKKSKGKKKS